MVIGDVHGCIDELKQLLVQNDFLIDENNLVQTTSRSKNRTITLLGDFVDKASDEKIAETIEFIYRNYFHLNQEQQRFNLIVGNHEQMIYRYATDDPTLEKTPRQLEKKQKYYNTAALLESDRKLREQFIKLYHLSYVWMKYDYSDKFSVTLTHAPCPKKHLAQNDEVSKQKMIKCTSRSKNRGVKIDDLIPYIHQEAENSHHYHIFGHLSQPNIRQYKNKICIDTSAIYGGHLSSVLIKKETLKFDTTPFQHKQLPATQKYNVLFDF